ncbi:Fanconi Anaemia group E protein [Macleaya cordata]|uniref:Fanconi Anaemia group E protein n=1 Tax=Macleaya cordata TaxID=56857 RepID=A0A200QD99_MACCD|nr:Fanconi Anaemia group E protein [Macleaya cordata]
MEAWVPLFDIFLNSPSPEFEASLWFQQSFDASTTTTTTTTSTSTTSFLSLLSKPVDVVTIASSSTSSSSQSKRIMYIQTLPNATQSRILSFLTVENQRFCSRDLSSLANNILKENQEVDFWVKKAALNLLDKISNLGFNWISSLSLDFVEETIEEDFHALPNWLQSSTNCSTNPLLPWLPIPYDELRSSSSVSCFVDENDEEDSVMEVEESVEGREIEGKGEVLNQVDVPIIDPEVQTKAASLKTQLLTFESASKTVGLANEICQLCLDKGGRGGRGNALLILGLIEPWEADDETASILISHFLGGNEEDVSWPSNVLCSTILPKLLVINEPASRLLVKATIEFCKFHQRAAVDALLFPMIYSKEGINTHVCDVITRIIKECLHPAHVSAFCQKVLCGEEEARRFMCLPCHQCLISDKLDSVDHLVSSVRELADRYSKSLKFGNFLLCLITKCHSLLKPNKLMLTETVKLTNTFMTKSILSKLDSL